MNYFHVCVACGLVLMLQIKKINGVQCGSVNTLQWRILNGEETTPGEWPFVAALYYNTTFFCGGTLISNKHVLTAAHCIQQKGSTLRKPEDIEVLLGAYNLSNIDENVSQRKKVSEIHIHPEWKVDPNANYDADLAILVLNENVSFTDYIKHVCLPADDAIIIGSSGSIVGWGLTEKNTESHSEVPKKAETLVLDPFYCLTTNPYLAFVSSIHMFCGAGGKGTPHQGDSGGGFFVFSGWNWVQYGIISVLHLGESRQVDMNTTAVYTNVREYKNWISDKIGAAISTTVDNALKINFTCNNVNKYCSMKDFVVDTEDVYFGSFTVFHPDGTNADIEYARFFGGTLNSVPEGIGKAFKNLKNLSFFDKLNLKVIRRSNFKNMEKLNTLYIHENDIVKIDGDTFSDLLNLRTLHIQNNKLRTIHEKAFERNTKLINVNLRDNELEFLPRNLFQNNAFLTYVLFTTNRLHTIEIDFSSMKAVTYVDLRHNKCISVKYDSNESESVPLVEFQRIIRTRCS